MRRVRLIDFSRASSFTRAASSSSGVRDGADGGDSGDDGGDCDDDDDGDDADDCDDDGDDAHVRPTAAADTQSLKAYHFIRFGTIASPGKNLQTRCYVYVVPMTVVLTHTYTNIQIYFLSIYISLSIYSKLP